MKKVQLNLGCGTNLMEDFINVDNYFIPPKDFPIKGKFIKADLRDLPFKKNSVDYILADQVLEHIPMFDVVGIFQEFRRILKKGGRCVVIVPEFKSAMLDWLSVDHDLSFQPLVFNYLSEVLYGNQLHEGEYHKTPFCPGFLNYALNVAGLINHKIIVYIKDSKIVNYPGMRPYPETALLRNTQLVADIIK